MGKISITQMSQTKLYKKIQTEKEVALNASRNMRHTGFEVIVAMSMKLSILWDWLPCSLANRH
jgi:hypothetical protein